MSSIEFADNILNLIFAYYFLANAPTTAGLQIRLVNKRFSILALPHIMHTISVDNISALVRLVSAPYSPLFHKPFSDHVLCFELAFTPYNYKLLLTIPISPSQHSPNETSPSTSTLSFPDLDSLDTFICKNLQVLRFKFTMGIPLPTDIINDEADLKKFNAQLYRDTQQRQREISANATWLCFLSKFSPRRFEWMLPSSIHRTIHFLGVFGDLSSLLRLWDNRGLRTIHLSGVCLVEQPSADAPWTMALPSENVRINGLWMHLAPFIACGLGGFPKNHLCKELILDEQDDKSGSLRSRCVKFQLPPIVETTIQDWASERQVSLRIPLSLSRPASPPPKETQDVELERSMPTLGWAEKQVDFGTDLPPSSPSHPVPPTLEQTHAEFVEHLRSAYANALEVLALCIALALCVILAVFWTCLWSWLAFRLFMALVRFAFWVVSTFIFGPPRLFLFLCNILFNYAMAIDWNAALSLVKMTTQIQIPQPTIPVAYVVSHDSTMPPRPMNTIPSRQYASQSMKYAAKICPVNHQSKAT